MDNIEERKDLSELILEIIANNQKDIEILLEDYHIYDITQAVLTLEAEAIKLFFETVSSRFASDIFDYLDEDEIERIIPYLTEENLINIISHMETDEAVDLLKYLEQDGLQLLKKMKQPKRRELMKLMRYDEDEIGAFMTDSFLTIKAVMTVKEAMAYVTKEAHNVEYISILYIIEEGRLVGYLKLKDLIVARANQVIGDIMDVRFLRALPTDDKETVAMMMRETGDSSIPIVDEGGYLLGIITHDDLMDIVASSEEEDYTKFAALSDIDISIESGRLRNSVRSRLPWLTILLGLSMITSLILSFFEQRFSVSNGAILLASKLAVYLPLILGMAGNTGTQSLAVMIRYLTKNEQPEAKEIKRHLTREIKTGLLQGFIIGVLIFAMIVLTSTISYSWLDPRSLIYALVTASSIFMALLVSTVLGALIPLAMTKLKIDPAVASGPFITTMTDILTLTLYYTVSLAILLPLFI